MAATGGGPDLTPVDVMIGDIIGTESMEGVVPVEEGDSDMTVRETQTTNEPGKSVSIIHSPLWLSSETKLIPMNMCL